MLWMLDHGVDLPNRPKDYSNEFELTNSDSSCDSNGRSRTITSTQISSFTLIDGSHFFLTKSTDWVLFSGDYGYFSPNTGNLETYKGAVGSRIVTIRFSGHGTGLLKGSCSTSYTCETTWTGPPGGVCVHSRVNGTLPEFTSRGLLYNGDEEYNYRIADISVSGCYVNSLPRTNFDETCSNVFTPNFLTSEGLYDTPAGEPEGPCACVPTGDIPYRDLPPQPVIGRIAYVDYGSRIFYPGWSSTTVDRTSAIALFSQLPLQYISVPVAEVQRDPLAARLFGDMTPPAWFLV